MTLITYFSRVHFADGVLEEALRSEIERNARKRPVIVAEEAETETEFSERLYASLPPRIRALHHPLPPGDTLAGGAAEITRRFLAHDADLLIAYGSRRALAIAREARHEIHRARIEAGPPEAWSNAALPDLYVVPGVDGLPNPARPRHYPAGEMHLAPARSVSPSVIVCDPTLTLGVAPGRSAAAVVDAMSRCIEAYLSAAFNPPADGIALDGLRRAVENIYRLMAQETLDVRRELMAAGLNGRLAQQKASGRAEALSEALLTAAGLPLDPGALKRLLLPGVLRAGRPPDRDKEATLCGILGVPAGRTLADGLDAFLAGLPLPRALSEMGLEQDHLDVAAQRAAETIEAIPPESAPDPADLAGIMAAIY